MPEKTPRKHAKTVPVSDADILQNQSKTSHSDVLGSYTGTAADDDIPEQDADDL